MIRPASLRGLPTDKTLVLVNGKRPEGKASATTDLNIAFIRPPLGDTLVATAQVIHAGKALFRTEIAVHSDDKLVAKANATFMIVSPMADG